VKSINLSALPDGGKRLLDEIRLLTENLRQLDVEISRYTSAQAGIFTALLYD